MMTLTPDETAWLKRLQNVLDECPSDRLGFYTIGDPEITVYDRSQKEAISKREVFFEEDFTQAIHNVGADFHASIRFPSSVDAVRG